MAFVSIVDIVYPVGSIYQAMSNTSPAEIFGGTWTQIKTFLYGGEGNIGNTGGAEEVTLYRRHTPSNCAFIGNEYCWVGNMDNFNSYQISSNDGSISNWTLVGSNLSTDKWWNKGNTTRGWYWFNNNEAFPYYYYGGGKAHENMPPYTVVKIWQRTA